MWGSLRRPVGPFQVTCVVVAAGFAAAFSTSAMSALRGWGTLPTPATSRLGRPGERANTVAVVSVMQS
jgi:hypothetical protein